MVNRRHTPITCNGKFYAKAKKSQNQRFSGPPFSIESLLSTGTLISSSGLPLSTSPWLVPCFLSLFFWGHIYLSMPSLLLGHSHCFPQSKSFRRISNSTFANWSRFCLPLNCQAMCLRLSEWDLSIIWVLVQWKQVALDSNPASVSNWWSWGSY